MCVNVIKVGPATYFLLSILVSFNPVCNQTLCTSWQYTSHLKHTTKKHGIWITKKWFFPLKKSKQQIQWLNDHLIKNYNPWKVHVPNKTLERSFVYQSYGNFFLCVIMYDTHGAWKLSRLWTWHDDSMSAPDNRLSCQLHML